MKNARLIFTVLDGPDKGHSWEHTREDWILTYCNFRSNPHPVLLRIGQSVIVESVKGEKIKIEAQKLLPEMEIK